MPAIDTVLGQVTNQVALTNITVAAGDSLAVRAFSPPARAYLEDITVKGGQVTTTRVLSPYLHDTTRGITMITSQAPNLYGLPKAVAQELNSQDALIVQTLSGGANSTVVALHTYYSDLGASSARLSDWGTVKGLIGDIKPVEIDVTASATIGQWNDLAFTTTENLLRANTDYAVLGYTVDVACCVVAFKGQDTGNLRISGPGTVLQDVSVNYFVDLDMNADSPHIPIINAANAANTTVSVADNAASTAVKVQLILAELSQNLGR